MRNRHIFTSILIGSSLLSGAVVAQEAPMLIGNYSANVEGAVNLNTALQHSAKRSFRSTATPQIKDPAPFGNYSANVRLEDVRGR